MRRGKGEKWWDRGQSEKPNYWLPIPKVIDFTQRSLSCSCFLGGDLKVGVFCSTMMHSQMMDFRELVGADWHSGMGGEKSGWPRSHSGESTSQIALWGDSVCVCGLLLRRKVTIPYWNTETWNWIRRIVSVPQSRKAVTMGAFEIYNCSSCFTFQKIFFKYIRSLEVSIW